MAQKKKRKSRPLLIATAGAASVVFGCTRPQEVLRIGPPPTLTNEETDLTPLQGTATTTATIPPMRIGPEATPVELATKPPARIGMVPRPTPRRIGPPVRIGPPPPPPTPEATTTTGKLAVTSRPFGHVFVDGEMVGMTPLQLDLDPGEYRVRIVNDEEQVEAIFRAKITSGTTLTRNVKLTPIGE